MKIPKDMRIWQTAVLLCISLAREVVALPLLEQKLRNPDGIDKSLKVRIQVAAFLACIATPTTSCILTMKEQKLKPVLNLRQGNGTPSDYLSEKGWKTAVLFFRQVWRVSLFFRYKCILKLASSWMERVFIANVLSVILLLRELLWSEENLQGRT